MSCFGITRSGDMMDGSLKPIVVTMSLKDHLLGKEGLVSLCSQAILLIQVIGKFSFKNNNWTTKEKVTVGCHAPSNVDQPYQCSLSATSMIQCCIRQILNNWTWKQRRHSTSPHHAMSQLPKLQDAITISNLTYHVDSLALRKLTENLV